MVKQIFRIIEQYGMLMLAFYLNQSAKFARTVIPWGIGSSARKMEGLCEVLGSNPNKHKNVHFGESNRVFNKTDTEVFWGYSRYLLNHKTNKTISHIPDSPNWTPH